MASGNFDDDSFLPRSCLRRTNVIARHITASYIHTLPEGNYDDGAARASCRAIVCVRRGSQDRAPTLAATSVFRKPKINRLNFARPESHYGKSDVHAKSRPALSSPPTSTSCNAPHESSLTHSDKTVGTKPSPSNRPAQKADAEEEPAPTFSRPDASASVAVAPAPRLQSTATTLPQTSAATNMPRDLQVPAGEAAPEPRIIHEGFPRDLSTPWRPRLDVIETAADLRLCVELPGVTTRSLRVELVDDMLSISGDRVAGRGRDAIFSTGADASPWSTYHYQACELPQGPFLVTWKVPKTVEKEAVSAELVDGILLVVFPKTNVKAK
eukprot:jgi/Mesvir1/4960/Mv11450-RA.1